VTGHLIQHLIQRPPVRNFFKLQPGPDGPDRTADRDGHRPLRWRSATASSRGARWLARRTTKSQTATSMRMQTYFADSISHVSRRRRSGAPCRLAATCWRPPAGIGRPRPGRTNADLIHEA